ncbi:MAG: hypothetical protein JXR30_04190 [Alphaproteobacteria bacterium]|nr:hypothetical protein [Alphaproteobacteria bacterium]
MKKIFALFLLLPCFAFAESGDHYLGGSASPFGFGGYYKYGFNSTNFWLSRLEVRGMYEHFGETAQDIVLGKDTTITLDDIDYKLGLESDAAGVVFDFYPFKRKSVFHLSAGAYYTDYLVSTTASPLAGTTLTIGDNTVTVNDLLVRGAVNWQNDISPYLGLGLSATLGAGITLGLDAGVMFTGSPEISIDYRGTVNGGTDVSDVVDQADINKEIQNIEGDLMAVDMLPVIRLSLGIRF